MLMLFAKDILPRNEETKTDLAAGIDSFRNSVCAAGGLRRRGRARSLREEPRSDPSPRQGGLSLLLPRLPQARQDRRRRDHARIPGVRESRQRKLAGHVRRERSPARPGRAGDRLRDLPIPRPVRRRRTDRGLRAAVRQDAEGLEDRDDERLPGAARHASPAARDRRRDARRRDGRRSGSRRDRGPARREDRLRRPLRYPGGCHGPRRPRDVDHARPGRRARPLFTDGVGGRATRRARRPRQAPLREGRGGSERASRAVLPVAALLGRHERLRRRRLCLDRLDGAPGA